MYKERTVKASALRSGDEFLHGNIIATVQDVEVGPNGTVSLDVSWEDDGQFGTAFWAERDPDEKFVVLDLC
ncbi:hypothetical protein PAPYRUS_48 [Mycobacterium phage Papyrus]|uniref:Uncharacterized protein n=1 Tax=Mycobacterium phage Papyrus TaxID=1383056 RepID=S5YRB2_9CAUD|nr:hypothetical protein N842_gp048 [Mycobacterium phage Papyrus]AGT14058.1 hypothetical protein PAPYRUS_48 [Mycobacterium phage Papyrus]